MATKKTDNQIEKIRHSLAHLLAMAVKEISASRRTEVKLGIGPTIENGFYYDFDFGTEKFSDSDLQKVEDQIKSFIKKDLIFKKENISADEAKKLFKDEPFKLELINDLAKEEQSISIYITSASSEIRNAQSVMRNEFVDLCSGPHINSTSEINPDAFKIQKIAGAYWKGSEKNPMLTRIYAAAFESKKELDEYLEMLAEAEKRDHKKLGPELDLFFIDEKVGKGLPMWTPKGTAIKFELENFTRNLERKHGYEHVCTPYLGAAELYKTSGHLDHYSKNMYAPIDMDGDIFYLRPMACPHHIRMYQRKPWSYKELPVRYAEIADYNRYEKSGELMGMIRVRKFQLTDAHIFVNPDHIKEEFVRVCELIREGMQGLGLDSIVTYRFSKRDPNNKEKYYPDDNLWNTAEALMKEALDEAKFEYATAEDEAAFYGPKLDVQAKNVNGKEDTLFTAQIDFLLPEKFDLKFIDKDGSTRRPVMIHRSAIGALERTFAFLIEHYAGAFPLWLSPVQVAVLNVGEKHLDYAKEVYAKLSENNIRAELFENDTLGKRIREAEVKKIPYIIVMGDKEISANAVAIRKRGEGDLGQKNADEFINQLKEEIADKK